MLDDMIPVTYYGGTGGNFLSHFLVSAKIKNKKLIRLDDTGSAHFFGLKDVQFSNKWIDQTDEYIINSLTEQIKKNSVPPYFFPVHLLDADLINKSFKKSIRIVYDVDDAEEIGTIFYKKFYTTPNAQAMGDKVNRYSIQDLILNIKYTQEFFKKEINMPNILFVTWKEYIHGEADDLITKLSSFVNIDSADFSKESLLLWRTATQQCLN